jgi:hypothetical protein
MRIWDLMTLSKSGLQPPTRSFSWISPFSGVPAGHSGEATSVPISGSGCGIIVARPPFLMRKIAAHAPQATLYSLCNPAAVKRFVTDVARSGSSSTDSCGPSVSQRMPAESSAPLATPCTSTGHELTSFL